MTKQISKLKKTKVYDKFKGKCAYCGKKLSLETMHIDHVCPKNSGGSNQIENLFPSCPECNASKVIKSLDDFRLHLMLSNSKFFGIINYKQWQGLNEHSVFINLPVHLFYFEKEI